MFPYRARKPGLGSESAINFLFKTFILIISHYTIWTIVPSYLWTSGREARSLLADPGPQLAVAAGIIHVYFISHFIILYYVAFSYIITFFKKNLQYLLTLCRACAYFSNIFIFCSYLYLLLVPSPFFFLIPCFSPLTTSQLPTYLFLFLFLFLFNGETEVAFSVSSHCLYCLAF